jgi:hypothetical protein
MENKEAVFLQESTKRNALGHRKIQVRENTYNGKGEVSSKILKTFDWEEDAISFMEGKGWGNAGYIKDLITGERKNTYGSPLRPIYNGRGLKTVLGIK